MTKFNKQSYVGLSGYEGKEHLNILGSSNAHCVSVLGIVSYVNKVGVMGCI